VSSARDRAHESGTGSTSVANVSRHSSSVTSTAGVLGADNTPRSVTVYPSSKSL